MQVDPVNSAIQTTQPIEDADNKPYTILRIKRKRNEEPLDALVIESRIPRKKSRNAVGVFQYAQTVESDAWDDAQRQRAIQEQISRLAQQDAVATDWKATVPPTEETAPSPIPQETTRRYTIVENDELAALPTRYPTAPPKVWSTKELEKGKSVADFKMYDAVLTKEQAMAMDQTPSEIDKFLPLLQDYLKIHDDAKAASNSPLPTSATDDDYVWDVFYHRPATVGTWQNVATVTGLPRSLGDAYDSASDTDEEVDEADEDSNAEEYYKNDYPEEEESDEFHDNSDQEDVIHYREEADDQCDDFP